MDIVPILEKLAHTDDIYPLLKLANSRSFRSITMLSGEQPSDDQDSPTCHDSSVEKFNMADNDDVTKVQNNESPMTIMHQQVQLVHCPTIEIVDFSRTGDKQQGKITDSS